MFSGFYRSQSADLRDFITPPNIETVGGSIFSSTSEDERFQKPFIAVLLQDVAAAKDGLHLIELSVVRRIAISLIRRLEYCPALRNLEVRKVTQRTLLSDSRLNPGRTLRPVRVPLPGICPANSPW